METTLTQSLGVVMAAHDGPNIPFLEVGGVLAVAVIVGVAAFARRLGKAFAKVEPAGELALKCGGGASGILVSSTARDAGLAGVNLPLERRQERLVDERGFAGTRNAGHAHEATQGDFQVHIL